MMGYHKSNEANSKSN